MRSHLIVMVLLLSGCVDPKARYDAFIERTAELRGGERDSGMMEPTDRFDWSGPYLLALSTTLMPDAPLLFAVESEVSEDLETIELTLQPLTTDDDDEPRTPIGDSFDISAIAYIDDGSFSADLDDVSVPGRANPITGSDIVANVQLSARTRAASDEQPDIFCGQVAGMVVEPLSLDLSGSSFGSVRTDDLAAAEPLLRCP